MIHVRESLFVSKWYWRVIIRFAYLRKGPSLLAIHHNKCTTYSPSLRNNFNSSFILLCHYYWLNSKAMRFCYLYTTIYQNLMDVLVLKMIKISNIPMETNSWRLINSYCLCDKANVTKLSYKLQTNYETLLKNQLNLYK